MPFDLQGLGKQISMWIRPIVLCFACGIGIGVAITATNAMIRYYRSRPKAWDQISIRATLAEAEPISEGDVADDLGFVPVARPEGAPIPPRDAGKSSDPNPSAARPLNFTETGSGVSFSVDLLNTTSSDLTIPKTVIIMQATRGTHTLHSSLLWLAGDYFIPAGHSVSATLENSGFCRANEDPQQCFDDHFKGDDEIVLFDQSPKYEIHISVPPIRIPKNSTKNQTEKAAGMAGH
jgi:hypothetical protein